MFNKKKREREREWVLLTSNYKICYSPYPVLPSRDLFKSGLAITMQTMLVTFTLSSHLGIISCISTTVLYSLTVLSQHMFFVLGDSFVVRHVIYSLYMFRCAPCYLLLVHVSLCAMLLTPCTKPSVISIIREREREREKENKSTPYNILMTFASLQTALQPANTSLIWWTHGCSGQECEQRSPNVTA